MKSIHERIIDVLEFRGESVNDRVPFLELKEGEYEFVLSSSDGLSVPLIMVKYKNVDTLYNTYIPIEWLVEQESEMYRSIKPIEATPALSGKDADVVIEQVLNPKINKCEITKRKQFYKKMYDKIFKK